MTEAEWRASENPPAMLDFLGRRASSRKLRLFCAACARRSFSWLERDPVALAVATKAEQLADGLASRVDLQKARRALTGSAPIGLVWTARAKPIDGARLYAQVQSVGAQPLHAAILREIFGHPGRPYVQSHPWPATVIDLAQVMYDGVDNRLILADALEESGRLELADHFRQGGWHPKGCWAMDLMLGKK